MLWRYRSAQRRSSPAPRNISSNWIKRNQTTHRDRFKVGLYLYRVKLFSTGNRFYTLSWAEAWHCHPFHKGVRRPEGTLRAHFELTEYIRLFLIQCLASPFRLPIMTDSFKEDVPFALFAAKPLLSDPAGFSLRGLFRSGRMMQSRGITSGWGSGRCRSVRHRPEGTPAGSLVSAAPFKRKS